MKSILSDVKVGDTLYDPGIRNDSRSNREATDLVVTKIGRLYITAYAHHKGWAAEYKIHIETGLVKVDIGSSYRVYRSKESFAAFNVSRELAKKIRNSFGDNYFRNPELPVDVLKKVCDLLEIEYE